MDEELKKQVHFQLLRTFRYRGKKGYCWLRSKFGNTRLQDVDDAIGQQMLYCLSAKEWHVECPVHGRIHAGKATTDFYGKKETA